MPLFAVRSLDDPVAAAVRATLREAHVAHVRQGGRVRIARPLLNADDTVGGSLVVPQAQDRADAEAFCAADPYAAQVLYASVDIRPFRPTFTDLPAG